MWRRQALHAFDEHYGQPHHRRQARKIDGFAQRGFGFMMMIEKSSGELVGHCGMKMVDNLHAPNQGIHEIGWLVREDRWRLGHAHEAMRAVIDWAFATIGVPHLVALTCERNVPSWRLMEKLGMTRQRDLEFADPTLPPQDSPTIRYVLTPDQWERAK